mgnify:FL=1
MNGQKGEPLEQRTTRAALILNDLLAQHCVGVAGVDLVPLLRNNQLKRKTVDSAHRGQTDCLNAASRQR